MDPDIKAVFATYRALKASSSPKMLEENLRFVAGHFGYEIFIPLKDKEEVKNSWWAEAASTGWVKEIKSR
jgi:hypothetical protein